ncbi:LacI family DNA-binding transcriptional regulator [Nonomuraea sp. NEAU-A123]|uniref:LacI family DNA-binding transcriptional regulator n=1 Tax=Nonomuraea sp. NEAU-A123 TaxID=2839649 RepID=UPI001BE3FA49|nr:LacI family DNA-binding transcriptional regulator [Nonomuraea sp. NEAU-A123]MBT2234185.1 LacI family transcriptional regulator [Nonomuraea sp. NEAU-A123]
MRADEPATILTVAKTAGVSKTTASDALRGSGRVSEETKARVMEAADALGYVPNGSARHLRRASTGTIGLHVPEVLTRSSYYMSFVFGVVQGAADNDYDVTLITSGRRTPRVDGLVLGDPLGDDPIVAKLMDTGLPTVTCERFTGTGRADGVVRSEHAEMLGRLMDHLRASGATRPALIVAGDMSDWAASVHRGFRDWCTRHGADPLVRTVPFDCSADEVHQAARDLLALEPRVDALVCGPAGSATDLLPLLREEGRDLLLASCVDSPAMLQADPPITAIDLRPREAGVRCAELLFDLLRGTSPAGTERIHPIELTLRASTQPS